MQKAVMSLICATLLVACSDESPFLSKQDAYRLVSEINASRDPFNKVGNVVAIIDNDVYYFNRLDTIPRKLTNSPELTKMEVKLSSDRSRIAYINEKGNPVIISARNGEVIETLTQFRNISQLGWIRNSSTLFMLIGQKVHLHGPALSFMQPLVYTTWDHVFSFSMNSIGDQGYFITRYNESGQKLEYRSTSQNLTKQYTSFEGDVYNYIDFYDDDGNFLLGFKSSSGGGIERIVCVEKYKFYASYEWSNDLMLTPRFNSKLEILLYGTSEQQKYHLTAVYLGTEAYGDTGLHDILTKTLTNYSSKTPIYVDWVQ